MTPHETAELRHAQNIGVPGTITLGSKNYPCRLIAHRGARFELEGGQQQRNRISIILLTSAIQRSELIDANGLTRTRELTHNDTLYRIDTGGLNISPHAQFYTLKATQPIG